MKILHLLSSPVFSGPAEPVSLLAAAQRALGHDVHVAIDRKRAGITSEELALPRLQASGLLDSSGLELSVKSNPLAAYRDVRRLRRRDADILHSHFTHDHVLARYGLPKGAKLIRSIHAPRSLRASTPKCHAFTVPYQAMVPKVPGGVPAIVLPALVDDAYVPIADRRALKAALGLPDVPLIGMVSTFQASRRHELAIDALSLLRARVPDAHLALVGDGELGTLIRARVLALKLTGAVTFTGYQQADDFPRWMQAFDEVWVLGLGNDFAGRAAAQARACGARVVTVDEGGLPLYADAIVAPDAGALAAAALTGERRDLAIEPVADVAKRVLALYEQVRG